MYSCSNLAPTSLTNIIHILTCLLQDTVPVLAALALLFFFWGLAQFILAAGNTEEQKKGRDRIIWGLISIFVIMSVAALVALLQQTFFGGTHSDVSSAAGAYNGSGYTNTITLPASGQPTNINPFTNGGNGQNSETP